MPLILPVRDDILDTLRSIAPRGVIPATHGALGCSGAVAGILRECSAPSLSPPPHLVTRAADLWHSSEVLAAHNLPVAPRFLLPDCLRVDAEPTTEGDSTIAGACLPRWMGERLLVRPRMSNGEGNETTVTRWAELPAAVESARAYGPDVVMERDQSGPVVHIVVARRSVVATVSPSHDQCLAPMSATRRRSVERLALRACEALSLGTLPVEVVVRLELDGNEVIDRIIPLPSFAKRGALARATKSAGGGYGELVASLTAMLGIDTQQPSMPRPKSAPQRAATAG